LKPFVNLGIRCAILSSSEIDLSANVIPATSIVYIDLDMMWIFV